MQNKQKLAIARKTDDLANIAPRQQPPMVTRVSLLTPTMGGGVHVSQGILHHPPRYAR